MKDFIIKISLSILASLTLVSCTISATQDSADHQLTASLDSCAHFDPMQLFIQTQGGPFNLDKDLLLYIDRIASRVFSASQYRNNTFTIEVANNSTPFAIAFPEGRIALSRGVFSIIENEAELAALLIQKGITSRKLKHHLNLTHRIIQLLDQKQTLQNALECELVSLKDRLQIDRETTDLLQLLGYQPSALNTLYEKIALYKSELFFPHIHEKIDILPQSPSLNHNGYTGKKSYIKSLYLLQTSQNAYQAYENALNAYENALYQKALDHINQALSMQPNEGLFYLLKGQIYMKIDQKEIALNAFSKSIECNANYFLPYYERAEVLKQLSHPESSKVDFQTACEYCPILSNRSSSTMQPSHLQST